MSTLALVQFDHYVYALVALLGTLGAVLAILWLMTRSPWQAQIRALHGVAPPFINVLGVLFGLTLAFIANDTWSAHDKATTAVYQEADAIRSVAVLSAQLDEPLRGHLQETLRTYAQASADEWASLARRSASPEADQRANALLRACADRQLEAALGSTVHALLLTKVSDIRHDRDQRISLSQMHLNPLKWVGMAFLGLLTLLSIAVVHVEHPRAAMVSIAIFALSAAPTAAIVLIQGNPFMQPSFVSPAPILAAAPH
jgi:hypothetical protein